MLDLDAILTVADGYAERMKIVRDHFDRREPVPEELKQYLAPLADDEVVKAFESLRPLVARVQELEAEADILAEQLAPAHGNPEYDVKYWRNWAMEMRGKEGNRCKSYSYNG